MWNFSLLKTSVRHSAKWSLRRPTASALALFSLAVGVFGAACVFNLVFVVLLTPLPFKDPEQLFLATVGGSPGRYSPVPLEEVREWLESASEIAELTPVDRFLSPAYRQGGATQTVLVQRVTGDYFRLLGWAPRHGRALLAEDCQPQAEPAAVLGESFARMEFGEPSAALGKKVFVGDASFTVVGVTASASNPLDWEVAMMIPFPATSPSRRPVSVFARIPKATSPLQAEQKLQSLHESYLERSRNRAAQGSIRLISLQNAFLDGHLWDRQPVRKSLLLIFFLMGLALAAGCSNASHFLTVQMAERQNEFGIRQALGASLGSLARQIFCESLIFAGAAAAAGLLAALALQGWLADLAPVWLRHSYDLSLRPPHVLLFGLLICLACALAGASAPILLLRRQDVLTNLAGLGMRGSPQRSWLTRALLFSQVGVAALLLVGVSACAAAKWTLLMENLGLDAQGVMKVDLRLDDRVVWRKAANGAPPGYFELAPRSLQIYRELLDAAASLPGVSSAGATRWFPCAGTIYFTKPGQPLFSDEMALPDGHPDAQSLCLKQVSPGYFSALGITLVRGRLLDRRDSQNAPLAVLIDEMAAARYWPGLNPVGERIRLLHDQLADPFAVGESEIVGVVKSASSQRLKPAEPTLYMPWEQRPTAAQTAHVLNRQLTLLLKFEKGAESAAPRIREALGRFAPEVSIDWMGTLDDDLDGPYGALAFFLLLLTVLSGMALTLSITGVYSVTSLAVSSSLRETGIRLALGARSLHILWALSRWILALAGAGLAAGLMAGWLLSGYLEALVPGLGSPGLSHLAGAGLLGGLVLLSICLPGRRALRVNLADLLKAE